MILNDNNLTIQKIISNLNDKNKQDKTINNLQIICDYYHNLHLLSYLYLKTINSRYLFLFVFASLMSGLIDLINYKDHYSDYLYLTCGILNIFLSIFFNTYKNLKIAENLQEHYVYSNKFQVLKYKINSQKTILDFNEEFCIYRSIYLFIKEINDEISNLLLTGPNFPATILNKNKNKNNFDCNQQKLNNNSLNLFNIKNILGINNNFIINDSSTTKQLTKRKMSMFFINNNNNNNNNNSSIDNDNNNDNINLDITEINDNDINNYKKFIDLVNNKKRERVKINDNIINI